MSYQAERSSTSRACPVLPGMTLAEFCREIGRVLDGVPDRWAPRLAARHLPGLLANPELLMPEQRVAPPGRYGRHCVFACPTDRFSVVAMVWPPGFTSPIHDHATWCALGVYEGVIEEHHFLPASDAPDERRALPSTIREHRAGMVTHLPVDAPNIHAMHNPGARPAISIHVYGGNTHKLGPTVNRLWSVEA